MPKDSAPDDCRVVAVLCLLALCACGGDDFEPDPAIDCDNCAAWNEPQAPFRIHGTTWYVGTSALSAILVDSGHGLVLIDAGLPQSAPLVVDNIRELGFDPADIRFIAVSHEHYDHAGGVAAIARYSGAAVLAGAAAADALAAGTSPPGDPQAGPGLPAIPPIGEVLAADADTVLALGDLRLRAVPTPGHTPGGTSWSWESCESGRCLSIVYADSLSPVSAPDYRFSDGLGTALETSATRLAALPCDIFLSTHDFAFGLHDKLDGGAGAFVDPDGCRRYAEANLARLADRLERERAAAR